MRKAYTSDQVRSRIFCQQFTSWNQALGLNACRLQLMAINYPAVVLDQIILIVNN